MNKDDQKLFVAAATAIANMAYAVSTFDVTEDLDEMQRLTTILQIVPPAEKDQIEEKIVELADKLCTMQSDAYNEIKDSSDDTDSLKEDLLYASKAADTLYLRIEQLCGLR